MRICECEHWEVCPTCKPNMFDSDGNMLKIDPPLTTAQLRAENEALKAELAEAKKDAERLDFLLSDPLFTLEYIGSMRADEAKFARRDIDAAMKGK